MHIVYIISTLRRCGPTNLLYDTIKYLPNNYEVSIITLSSERDNSRWEDFEAISTVKRIQKANCNNSNLFILGKLVKQMCIELKPDVIHTQGFRPDIISAIFLKYYKRVYNIQNYPYDDFVMQFGWKGYIMAFLNIYLLRNEKYVTVCSKYVKSKIEKSFNQPLHVVQNAVEIGFEERSEEDNNSLRKKFGFTTSDKIFVFAGNLIKRKNPIYLIKAFNEVNKSDTSLKLLILGDGYLMNECKELAKNNASIIFAGNVNDVSNYYQISHYYITASLSEGMPVSVLEALNHKLPVLLSNISQHAEVVDSIHTAGMLFDKENNIDLQNKIKDFIQRDYQQMQIDAVSAIKQQFNAKRMSTDFQNLYNLN